MGNVSRRQARLEVVIGARRNASVRVGPREPPAIGEDGRRRTLRHHAIRREVRQHATGAVDVAAGDQSAQVVVRQPTGIKRGQDPKSGSKSSTKRRKTAIYLTPQGDCPHEVRAIKRTEIPPAWAGRLVLPSDITAESIPAQWCVASLSDHEDGQAEPDWTVRFFGRQGLDLDR